MAFKLTENKFLHNISQEFWSDLKFLDKKCWKFYNSRMDYRDFNVLIFRNKMYNSVFIPVLYYHDFLNDRKHLKTYVNESSVLCRPFSCLNERN